MTPRTENAEQKQASFPIAYRILNVEPWTFLDVRGNPTPGFRITYTFEGGFVDFVDVAERSYGPEAVKAAIEERIAKHIGVLALG